MRGPHCHRSLNSPLTPATALVPVAAAVVDRRGHCGRLGRLPDVVVVRCWRLPHIAGGGGPRGSCGVAGGGGWGWRRPAQRRWADAPCRGRRPSRRPPAADGGRPDEGPHACRRSHRRRVGRRTGHPSGERCVWQCYLQGPTPSLPPRHRLPQGLSHQAIHRGRRGARQVQGGVQTAWGPLTRDQRLRNLGNVCFVKCEWGSGVGVPMFGWRGGIRAPRGDRATLNSPSTPPSRLVCPREGGDRHHAVRGGSLGRRRVQQQPTSHPSHGAASHQVGQGHAGSGQRKGRRRRRYAQLPATRLQDLDAHVHRQLRKRRRKGK